ncbi:MAG: transposase family protein [Gammaproteobacteria bacterium]|nr:transposase family protein [Gammaproteobacteria bacterium]MYF01543.1 transposase family protein [Gammaproteobacteria bacterium]MYI77189.1 transposase family protein [Gammaproteobacteria bacterium]
MARKHYSLEYREQIVALVKSGRSITSVAQIFGLADQTLQN